MSILCSICGRLSQDPEFCDHCNADLGTSGKSLPPERCPLAANGGNITEAQRHILLFPEASVVVAGEDAAWRVHWISNYDWRERGPAIEKRLALNAAVLPTGRIVDDPAGRWLAYPTRPNAECVWPTAAPTDWPAALQRLADDVQRLADVLHELHRHALAWLNFDPGYLESAGADQVDGPLHITNLDVEAFPFGAMPERVRVHPHYAAPEIVQFRAEEIGPRTDVFHLAAFTYYWLAGVLPDGLAGDGLEVSDFALPFLRVYAPQLPVGILPIVRRGLALQPADRFATPLDFARALREAVDRAYRRHEFQNPLRWDAGGLTRTGKSKSKLGRNNEDSILIKTEDHAALVLVADGVSTCDIGSGGLASMMTTIVIENALAEGCSHESFPSLVTEAALRGSQGLLEWALAHNCGADLEAGKDLMGTTLTVGWLEGHELSVANLGDSRTYLITADLVEQLTVDGDLTSDLLARGAAPEEVRQLGAMGRALRECVGGCVQTEDGSVSILVESSTPNITRWPLLPGDVVVLCTDGLVEEGFFLEPAMLAAVVRRHRELPAAEIAQLLVDAADAMQRVPSDLEPDGFGDNISCVVVKIKE